MSRWAQGPSPAYSAKNSAACIAPPYRLLAMFLMSVSMGNLFTSAVNFLIQDDSGASTLSGAEYYVFFAVLMLAAAVGFAVVARRMPVRAILQEG